jgi:hypothetical protein
MILDPNQPFFDKAQRLSSWGHWFTFFNILFALLLSSRFIATDVSPATVLGYAYLITNWIGHTAFITFVCFLLSVFPISLVFPYPKHIRGISAVIATAGMVLLTIDAYSYSRLGYHISGSSLEQVISLLTNTWNDHPVRSFMWVAGITLVIFIFELLVSNFSWKRIELLRNQCLGGKLTAFFLTAFVSSHLIHIWADATFDYDVTKQNNMFPFSYPATAKTLLAKNGLLDKHQYEQTQADQLALKQNLDYFPKQQQLQCDIREIRNNLMILVTTSTLDEAALATLRGQGYSYFDKHYVPTNSEDAIFNLLYGLPSLYKDSIIANRQLPQWYELAQDYNLTVDLDAINSPQFAGYGFITKAQKANSSDIKISIGQIENERLIDYLDGLADSNVILISLPAKKEDAITKTPMLVKWSTAMRYKGQVTQNLGINTTIIESWLNCKAQQTDLAKHTTNIDTFGKNILLKQPKVLAANYTAGTIVSIEKDKITLLDDQGNDLQISATNGYKLNQVLEIPMLNDTINLLKRYSVRGGQ